MWAAGLTFWVDYTVKSAYFSYTIFSVAIQFLFPLVVIVVVYTKIYIFLKVFLTKANTVFKLWKPGFQPDEHCHWSLYSKYCSVHIHWASCLKKPCKTVILLFLTKHCQELTDVICFICMYCIFIVPKKTIFIEIKQYTMLWHALY